MPMSSFDVSVFMMECANKSMPGAAFVKQMPLSFFLKSEML